MDTQLSSLLRAFFSLASQPYLVLGVLALVAVGFLHFFGVLGLIVLTGNPLFLVALGWALFLLFLPWLGKYIARATKAATKAFAQWIKRSVLKLKAAGILEHNEYLSYTLGTVYGLVDEVVALQEDST